MIVIEGTGGPPVELENMPLHERLRQWIESTRSISGRTPKRYKTLEDAYQRMHEANSHLREDQARNLTIHGTNQMKMVHIAGNLIIILMLCPHSESIDRIPMNFGKE